MSLYAWPQSPSQKKDLYSRAAIRVDRDNPSGPSLSLTVPTQLPAAPTAGLAERPLTKQHMHRPA